MKKIFITLMSLIFATSIVIADEKDFYPVADETQIFYSPSLQTWSTETQTVDEIILTKRLFGGPSGNSEYYFDDGKRAMILSSQFELIKDGKLFSIDNNNLKYYEISFDGTNYEENPLSTLEIQKLFPDSELLRLSHIDIDNKMWIHKNLFKKKQILFVNDTNKYFYRLTANCTKAQNQDIRGLITLSRYGIYRFKHYGKRDGKLTIYVR